MTWPRSVQLSPDLRRRMSVKWSACPDDVLPAWVAEMDFALAPPVAEAAHRVLDGSDLGYAPREGVSGVEDAAAAWYASCFGWDVDPSRVFLLGDVIYGLELALALWTAPGEGVVVMTPAYPPFFEAVTGAGRRVVDVPLLREQRWAPDLDRVEDALRGGVRAVVLCNPHNPTGRVLDSGTLRALGDLVVAYDALLVADEVHAPVLLDGVRHVPVASLGDEIAAHTLTLSSASKGWNVPGLHCAFGLAGSGVMRQRLRALPHRAFGGTSIPGLAATVAALREGGPWLADVRAALVHNRDLLGEQVATLLPEAGYRPPQATYLAWLDLRAYAEVLPPGVRVADHLVEHGRVWLAAGEDFGPVGAGHVRLNFATSPEILTEVVERVARGLGR